MRDQDASFPTQDEDELSRELEDDEDDLENEDEWECLGGARFYGTMRAHA
jgi:hypothetical protein